MPTSRHTAAVTDQPDKQALWTLAEVAAAVGGAVPHKAPPDTAIGSIEIDSRKLQPGGLFIALPGDLSDRFRVSSTSARDGHDYVVAAAEAGAAAAIVSRKVDVSLPQVLVEDTLDALWALGRAGRARLTGTVFAVTGSSGKTTFKSMLAEALGAAASEGSFNNHLGVPISLASTPRAATAAVFEIGTSSPGEIAPLARMVSPDVAVVLNVQNAHIENFPNRDALLAEKLSIAEGLGPSGTLVAHDELPDELVHAPRVLRFGTSSGADVQLLSLEDGRASYSVSGKPFQARVPGGGWHRGLTLGAVIASMSALGFDLARVAALNDANVPRGRGNVIEVGPVSIVDDSYNANPASMHAALRAFRERSARRHLAVLGEMLELGPQSQEMHLGLAPEIEKLDEVWLVGAGMKDLEGHHVDRAGSELLQALSAAIRPGDAILVKGSNRVFWTQGFVTKLHEALKARFD